MEAPQRARSRQSTRVTHTQTDPHTPRRCQGDQAPNLPVNTEVHALRDSKNKTSPGSGNRYPWLARKEICVIRVNWEVKTSNKPVDRKVIITRIR